MLYDYMTKCQMQMMCDLVINAKCQMIEPRNNPNVKRANLEFVK